MPYATNADLPDSVKNNIPSKGGKDIFRNVFNSQLDRGKSETVAFASAWGALQNAGYEQNDKGKWIKVQKRYVNDDAFTRVEEAMARSFDLGFEGATHIHETADGQKVFMPGPTHEAYLGTDEEQEENVEYTEHEHTANGGVLSTAICAIINAIVGNKKLNAIDYARVEKEAAELARTEKTDIRFTADIKKADHERRIVYGWASVISEDGEPVVDRQGDVISPDEMEKAADAFMLSARMAKAMHDGDGIGEFVHSLPLTDEIAKAFGIDSNKRGWIVAVKVHDEDVWKRVKSGELSAFSIGGKAMREAING